MQYLKHLKLFSNPNFNIPYVVFIELSYLLFTYKNRDCIFLLYPHIFTGGLLAEVACHVACWSGRIKQSNVHTYWHRQSVRILRPFSWGHPQSYVSVAKHSSPCPYRSWEKDVQLAAPIWAFLKPLHWLSVIHTQLCKKCIMRLILSA